MWKFDIKKYKDIEKASVDQIIQAVEKYDGVFLFTTLNKYYPSNLNIVGLNPVIKIYDDKTIINGSEYSIKGFEAIENILKNNKSEEFLPFILGYSGFDYKYRIEEANLYQNIVDDRFPIFYYAVFQHYLILDSTTPHNINHYELSFPFEFDEISLDLKNFKKIPASTKVTHYGGTSLSKNEYIKSVDIIRNYIKSGDIYQVNLTREIFGQTDYSLAEIAKKLYYSNNIEFGVIANINGSFILSTSPERFFRIAGEIIITSPIKGTIKKTKFQDKNKLLINQLLDDKKELSELAMIVDLLRNDIGKICIEDSVKVEGYPIVKELENVFHLVADIKGIKKVSSFEEIMKGVFPGGSISGCPKIRAIQIIEELEKKGRGPYTGSFGYISLNGTMDFNILIRTLFYNSQNIWFNVGGGVTLKSDSLKEYEETIHKASNIWEAINMEFIMEERYCI